MAASPSTTKMRERAFTLIELLVVMAIVATLLSLVAPQYFRSVEHAKETALKSNLRLMRDAIDKHFTDTGRYPLRLDELVSARYLRHVPVDPFTDRANTWLLIGHPSRMPGIYDVRSGAQAAGVDGTPVARW